MRKRLIEIAVVFCLMVLTGLIFTPSHTLAGIIQAIIPAAVPTPNKQGNGSLFQLGSGAVTNGHCGSFDGNGNIVDSGVACSSSGAGTPGSTFFSSTTQAGPNDTAAETSLIGSVAGSTTILANTFTNGAYMHVEGQGYFSLPAVGDSLTIKAKCGSTVLGSASFTPAAGAITNGTFRVWLGVTAIGSGAGGAFNTNGGLDLYTGGPTPFESAKILNTSNVAYNFTTSCVFNLTAQWGGAQVGELMIGSGVVAYVPGAPVTSVNGMTGAVTVNGTPAAWPLNPTITTPSLTGFTWVNQGSSTITTINSVPYVANGGGSDAWYIHSAPGTPWTYTVLFVPNSIDMTVSGANNGHGPGLLFYNSGAGTGHLCYTSVDGTFQSGAAINSQKWNTPTSFSGNYVTNEAVPFAQWYWLRIQDNGINRICSQSRDGINFIVLSTIGRTDFLTADSYGILVGSASNYTIASALQN